MPLIVPPQGRVTPVTGVAVPTATIAGVTSLFYTPCGGNAAPILTSGTWAMVEFAQLTLPLSPSHHAAATLFDLFVFGNPLKLGTAPAPAATEIVDGIEVNSGSLTLRWGTGSGDVTTVAARAATRVGTFRTSLAGETRLTPSRIDIANLWNRVPITRFVGDPETSWTHIGGWRAVRGGLGPRIDFVQVANGIGIRSWHKANMTAEAGQSAYVAIGLDSDLPLGPLPFVNFPANPPISFPVTAEIVAWPERGYRSVRALESATGVATFHGQTALAGLGLTIEG